MSKFYCAIVGKTDSAACNICHVRNRREISRCICKQINCSVVEFNENGLYTNNGVEVEDDPMLSR